MSRADAKTKQQHEQAARAIANGEPIRKALLDAGYSQAMAGKGRRAIESSRGLQVALQKAMKEQFKPFMDLGAAVNANEQENIARGRLLQNVIDGSDAGVQSAKLLWQDKRVNQLVAENQLGVIVVQGAATLPTLKAETVEAGLMLEGEIEPAS